MKKIFALILTVMLMVSALAGCAAAPTENNEAEKNVETSENVETESNEADSNEAEAGLKMVNTADLEDLLEQPEVVVVDTRSTYAFNGWTLNNEARGGHIKGATVFSTSWLNNLEGNDAILTELDRYSISKDNTVVTYGYGTESATELAEKLKELGYENVMVYEDGFEVWASDDTLEVASMPHYEYLVHPQWVKEGLESKSIKVFEASWGPGDKYKKAHIPEAAHINTDDFEEGPLWNRKSDEEIGKSVLSNGITKDMTVVLYGEDITASARIALILKYAGVEDVRLLDGGFKAWQDAGFEIASGGVEKTPVAEFGAIVPVHPEYIIDMDEAKGLLDNDNGRLVSIRSWVEFTGETSGYDYIEAAGRIDGAVYGFAGSDPWHMEDYRTPDNTMVNYEYMADRWNEQNISMDTVNSFYCGTGWRAAETWFYAHAMDWDNVSVYDGGWKEWSETEGNPTAKGEPQS